MKHLFSFNGIEACSLVDGGSMVTTLSEEFYHSLTPLPTLLSLDDFNLSVHAAGGHTLPYSGYIECTLSGAMFGDHIIEVPVLFLSTVKHCRNLCQNDNKIPKEWNNVFLSFEQSRIGVVKTTDVFTIRLQPIQTVIVAGFSFFKS